MESKEPLYQAVLGPGGAGKSFGINEKLKVDPNYCLRTSTTGISAINMGSANGSSMATTINSALGFFDTASLLHKYVDKSIQKHLEKIGDRYSYIAIDEVGMCEAPMLDIIYLSLEEYNINAQRNAELGRAHNTKPLGLIILGDSAQLPPVSNKPFFEAKYWDKFDVTYLTRIYRQEDAEFVEALTAVRFGEAERIVDWFEANVGFHPRVNRKYRGSTFFTTHKQVNAFNARELAQLPGESTTYYRSITGKASPVWKDIPESVELKVGALVCLNINNFNAGYANGDMGYIEALYNTQVLLRLIRNEQYVYIEKCTIEYIPPGDETPVGKIRFMPMRLAWARTIHSCQSQTIEAVQCRIGGSFMPRCSGMMYTALSRVRTKEGLRLVGTKEDFIESTFVEPKYLKYIK